MFEKLKKGPTDDKSTNPRIRMPWAGRQWSISHFPLSSPENHLKVVEENHTHWKKLKNFRNNWESCCSLLSLIRYQKTPFARKYLKPENVYKALCVAMLHAGFVSKKLDWKAKEEKSLNFVKLVFLGLLWNTKNTNFSILSKLPEQLVFCIDLCSMYNWDDSNRGKLKFQRKRKN